MTGKLLGGGGRRRPMPFRSLWLYGFAALGGFAAVAAGLEVLAVAPQMGLTAVLVGIALVLAGFYGFRRSYA